MFDVKIFVLLIINTSFMVSRCTAVSDTGSSMSPIKFDTTNETINTKINGVNIRFYKSSIQNKTQPLIIHFHGGGFVSQSVDAYDEFLRMLVEKTKYPLISVEYSLAPIHPFPIALNECYNVTKYLIENKTEFNFDKNRIILIGDSAGGNIVSFVTQKLAKENLKQPKLQILIYPRMQFYSNLLPSQMKYENFEDIIKHPLKVSAAKLYLWYIGITYTYKAVEVAILTNQHTLLIEDVNLRKKYQSYLSVDFIPEEYKKGRSYYDGYKSEKMQNFVYPTKLDENSILLQEKYLVEAIKKLLTPDASPSLAEDVILKKLPKAYFIILEKDRRKDEGLIYAGRLRANNVSVETAFYENGFHGIANFVNQYALAREMLDGIVKFIEENI